MHFVNGRYLRTLGPLRTSWDSSIREVFCGWSVISELPKKKPKVSPALQRFTVGMILPRGSSRNKHMDIHTGFAAGKGPG